MCYFTFGDVNLVRDGYGVYNLLVERGVTVGQLYRYLYFFVKRYINL